ncbi:MAG: hypothetical protein PW735_11425 [Acidobacteriaceae bacterium]|nr:hypothetical protein [Acidobacteriaceae bacterium]
MEDFAKKLPCYLEERLVKTGPLGSEIFMLPQLLLLLNLLSPQFNTHTAPPSGEPIRNAFATASESLLDQAAIVDFTATPAAIDSQIQTLNTADKNLQEMVDNDQEKTLLEALESLLFTLRSCRIQALDGSDLSACQKRIDKEQRYALSILKKHKENGIWVDGPPA